MISYFLFCNSFIQHLSWRTKVPQRSLVNESYWIRLVEGLRLPASRDLVLLDDLSMAGWHQNECSATI